jgi:MFS family permease
MALGPTIGGLLIRFTGHVPSVFYLAGSLHLMFCFLAWFVIPESLAKGHMELAKARYADSLPRADSDGSLVVKFTGIAQHLFSFLRPLAILGPTEKVPGSTLKRRRKDWNLTLLAVAYGFTIALTVSVLRCIFNNI